MFRKANLFSALLLGTLFIGGGFFMGYVRDQDIRVMREQIQHQKMVKSSPLFSTTQQQRKGVIKEIWFSQEEGDRLHHRICSDTSLLTLVPQGNKLDLIEKLSNITCWMQDKLYNGPQGEGSFQQARLLKAQEGFYKYSSQEFMAQSVDLSLYRLEGTELPFQSVHVNPFLKGVAKDVSFSVSGKTSQFKAQQFKAELRSVP